MSQSETLPAPILDSPPLAADKWQRERLAFLCLLPELMRTPFKQYIAVHEGRVVASGTELAEAALEAYSRHGYVPDLCGLGHRPKPARGCAFLPPV